ncbi:copper resistance protein CopD [Campylobacter sp. MIT 12-5580]|uniref:copper resistance protein CopD n=1 Tax=Campylobacter sp. MIT 12-5580 TaxID=2040651 RepID=UPI0010F892D1|nr:copper resistance protein CopD [Campylobacter sp. MIT 12-5580]TKX29375.1 copper resistance protein CopD [Campylobacter sp. MIT 12-5580]
MQILYPYFLTLHLLCAIIFLGFIFTDVVLLSRLKKAFGEQKTSEILTPVMKVGVKIMPVCVLLLVLSGGAMMSSYIGFSKGFFDTPLQTLLSIKIILALVIVCFVLNALCFKLVLKRVNPLAAYTHKIVFCLGFVIVILAKFAFFV